MPSRAGRAGFFTTTNFAKPGRTNTPFFFSSLWPTSTSASTTCFTCLRVISSPTLSATALRISLFEMDFLDGDFAMLGPLLGLRRKPRFAAHVNGETSQKEPFCAFFVAQVDALRPLTRAQVVVLGPLPRNNSVSCRPF